MDVFELQELKTALLDEIQNAFKDKKNPDAYRIRRTDRKSFSFGRINV